jgi:hypothetical protein
MPWFRKKPIVVEAVQYLNDDTSLEAIYAMGCNKLRFAGDGTPDLMIPTLEGDHRAPPRWWIVRGIKGEFYPVEPNIFDATYTEVGAPNGK